MLQTVPQIVCTYGVPRAQGASLLSTCSLTFIISKSTMVIFATSLSAFAPSQTPQSATIDSLRIVENTATKLPSLRTLNDRSDSAIQGTIAATIDFGHQVLFARVTTMLLYSTHLAKLVGGGGALFSF